MGIGQELLLQRFLFEVKFIDKAFDATSLLHKSIYISAAL